MVVNDGMNSFVYCPIIFPVTKTALQQDQQTKQRTEPTMQSLSAVYETPASSVPQAEVTPSTPGEQLHADLKLFVWGNAGKPAFNDLTYE